MSASSCCQFRPARLQAPSPPSDPWPNVINCEHQGRYILETLYMSHRKGMPLREGDAHFQVIVPKRLGGHLFRGGKFSRASDELQGLIQDLLFQKQELSHQLRKKNPTLRPILRETGLPEQTSASRIFPLDFKESVSSISNMWSSRVLHILLTEPP